MTFPQMFVGKDGRLYVKNIVDNEKYSYAVYKDKDQYDNGKCLPEKYVEHDVAMSQYDIEEIFEFVLRYGEHEEIIQTNLAGDIIEPIEVVGVQFTIMTEYLKMLRNRYGDDLKYQYTKKQKENAA